MALKKVLGIMLIFIGIMIISSQTFAQQELDKAQFKFYYEYAWEFDTLTYNDTREDLIILQVGQNISKSYSYYSFQSDSLRSTKDGNKVNREATAKVLREAMSQGKIPRNLPYTRRTPTIVYKNHPEGQVTVTDAISGNYYICNEELNSQKWEIIDSVKTILEYTCQMAVSDFRGRRWTAWFAPDIPISDGPWKLSGLPGLIMEAYDAKKHYHFNIVGIEKVDDEPIVFSPVVLSYGSFGKYEETNRITFLRGRFRYRHNMPDIMNNQLGMDIFSASTPSSHPHDFIERDYW